jgi:hypothetical protein
VECERSFQILEIGDNFVYNAGTKRAMSKRRRRLDLAGLRGPEIFFHRILIVVSRGITGGSEECEWSFQKSEIGNVFVYNTGIKRAMGEWRQQLDSVGLKGPEISLHQILIVV